MKLKDTPWKKSNDTPGQHVKNQSHYFTCNGSYSRSYGFSSSHIQTWELDQKKKKKKAEDQRIGAIELWCWRILLQVPWTARRSNQSTLKEINAEYSLEGLMLKLKLQYIVHLMQRADSLEKTLLLGKIEGRRKRGWQRIDGITDSMDMSLSKLWEMMKDREAYPSCWHGMAFCIPWGNKELDILNDWTATIWLKIQLHNRIKNCIYGLV